MLFYTDATLAAETFPVNIMGTLGEADMVKLVGHKFWSPKGVAAMHVWSGCLNERGRRYPGIYGSAGELLLGGGQEGGRQRNNTEYFGYSLSTTTRVFFP